MSHAHPSIATSELTDEAAFARSRESFLHLGMDLSRIGYWGRPGNAVHLWEWLRDERPAGAQPLAGLAEWFGNLLGLGPGYLGDSMARWLGFGFVQGIECAHRGVPLPPDFATKFPADLVGDALDSNDILRWSPDECALSCFRQWCLRWMSRNGVGFHPTDAWKAGAAFGAWWMQRAELMCGAALVQFEAARWEQRFASQALATHLERPHDNPWQALVKWTYPPGCPEGAAIAESSVRSLDRARHSVGRLREFLLDAVREGFFLASTDLERAKTISLVPGPGKLRELACMFEGHAGSLRHPADPDQLLHRVACWLHGAHPELMVSTEFADAVLVLRHAYDYLWWRGLLEGLTQRGVPLCGNQSGK